MNGGQNCNKNWAFQRCSDGTGRGNMSQLRECFRLLSESSEGWDFVLWTGFYSLCETGHLADTSHPFFTQN